MKRRAFTLIELLVVIAIIAILAAILFPVFAQAKIAAKKSVTLSNCKQLGTAQMIYVADFDDYFPLSYGVRPQNAGGGAWFIHGLTPMPQNSIATPPWDDPIRQAMQAGVMWANSTHPYTKNYGITGTPVSSIVPTAGDTYPPGMQKTEPALTMNGFMTNLSTSEITAPSAAILLWSGRGNVSGQNRALMNPSLNCTLPWASDGSVPMCRFNPAGPPQAGVAPNYGWSGAYGTNGRVWTFEKQAVYVKSDTSAKVGRCGGTYASGPNNTPAPPPPTSLDQGYADPFYQVTQGGFPAPFAYIVTCGPNAQAMYWCFFRPDRER